MRRDTSCRACRGQSAVGGSRGLGARRSVVRGARPGSGWTGRGTGGGGRGGGAGPRGGRVARGDGGYPGERPARAMSQEQGRIDPAPDCTRTANPRPLAVPGPGGAGRGRDGDPWTSWTFPCLLPTSACASA